MLVIWFIYWYNSLLFIQQTHCIWENLVCWFWLELMYLWEMRDNKATLGENKGPCMLKWNTNCFCLVIIILYATMIIEPSYKRGPSSWLGKQNNPHSFSPQILRMSTWPRFKQSEALIFQSTMIDRGQASDPNQANQGTDWIFLLKLLKKNYFQRVGRLSQWNEVGRFF